MTKVVFLSSLDKENGRGRITWYLPVYNRVFPAFQDHPFSKQTVCGFLNCSDCSSMSCKTRRKLIPKKTVTSSVMHPYCLCIPIKQWKHLCGCTTNRIGNWSSLKPTKKKENSCNVNQFLAPVLCAAAQMLVLAQEDDAEAKTKGRERPRCWKLGNATLEDLPWVLCVCYVAV